MRFRADTTISIGLDLLLTVIDNNYGFIRIQIETTRSRQSKYDQPRHLSNRWLCRNATPTYIAVL